MVYLLLVITLPLFAMLAYFAWVFVGRDLLAACPPDCRGTILFQGGNLSTLTLRNADLRVATLSRAFLDGVDLRGADLSFANLSNASAVAADFTGANLTAVLLAETDARQADFTRATLRCARLDGANLTGANHGADLTATLAHTTLTSNT